MFGKNKKEPIKKPETAKDRYSFTYRMSYDEAFDAFSNLASKWKPKTQKIISAVIAVIAVVFLIIFIADNTKIHYFVIALIAIAILALVVYGPVLKAKSGAAKVSKTGGTYRVEVMSDGGIKLPNGEVVRLDGDKSARSVETSGVFAIRADNAHTFCIPKRIVNSKDQGDIRKILETYTKYENRQNS